MHTRNRAASGELFKGSNSAPELLESLLQQRTAAVQSLSARLLRVQEEERRRLARELHDSTGQTLTALKLELAGLQERAQLRQPVPESLAHVLSLVDQALREIRTMSYLMYPPLLDETGLCSAARWYVEGFAQRSSIQIALHLASFERLPRSIEIALFRVLQESLTNVFRHSESRTADIRLQRNRDKVILEVKDFGKGIPADLLRQFWARGNGTGVGLAGMRERIHEIRGNLKISSDATGTLIRAVVPVCSQPAPQDEDGIRREHCLRRSLEILSPGHRF